MVLGGGFLRARYPSEEPLYPRFLLREVQGLLEIQDTHRRRTLR